MSISDTQPTLETLDLVILTRLLVPGRAAKARDDVGKIAAARLAAGEWSAAFDVHWAGLVDRGFIALPPGKKGGKTFALTDAGRQRALDFLQVTELPAKPSWSALQTDYLVPLAMGARPASPEARKLKTAPQLKLAVIARSKQLSLREPASAKSVLASLAWTLIGVESDAPFTAENVIQQLALSQRPGKKITTAQVATALAASAVGSTRAGVGDLRLGAIRQWLLAPVKRASLSPEEQLERFASEVIDAARRSPAAGRFGDNKVFISHVWRQLDGRPAVAGLDLGKFKERLVEANRDGLLHLSRADLVEAMDPADVRESSTDDENATFHFVRI